MIASFCFGCSCWGFRNNLSWQYSVRVTLRVGVFTGLSSWLCCMVWVLFSQRYSNKNYQKLRYLWLMLATSKENSTCFHLFPSNQCGDDPDWLSMTPLGLLGCRLTLCGMPEDVSAAQAEAEEIMRRACGKIWRRNPFRLSFFARTMIEQEDPIQTQ